MTARSEAKALLWAPAGQLWCVQVQQLADAEGYEGRVVESLFKGRAGDDRENALEAAVDALKPRLDEVRAIPPASSSLLHAQPHLSCGWGSSALPRSGRLFCLPLMRRWARRPPLMQYWELH